MHSPTFCVHSITLGNQLTAVVSSTSSHGYAIYRRHITVTVTVMVMLMKKTTSQLQYLVSMMLKATSQLPHAYDAQYRVASLPSPSPLVSGQIDTPRKAAYRECRPLQTPLQSDERTGPMSAVVGVDGEKKERGERGEMGGGNENSTLKHSQVNKLNCIITAMISSRPYHIIFRCRRYLITLSATASINAVSSSPALQGIVTSAAADTLSTQLLCC